MRTLGRVIKVALKHWQLGVVSVVCMLITSGLQLTWPQIQRLTVDQCLVGRRYDLLPFYAVAYFGVFALQGLFQLGRAYASESVAQRTVYDIRNRLFNHIQRLSFTYHDDAETGQLISRCTTDTETLTTFLGGGMVNLVVNSAIAVGIVFICFDMNWQLTVISLSLMPFLAVTVFKYSGVVGPKYTDLQNHIGKMTSAIQQNTMGIRVVKAFAREDHEVGKFHDLSKELFRQVMNVTKIGAFYSPLMDFITAAGTTFILWYGGMQVITGRLTLGELVSFNTYLSLLVGPVRIMAWLISIVQNSIASGDRVFEILDTRQETHHRDGLIEMRECEGHVEFRDVSFTYIDGTQALNGLSFEAKTGQMIGIMGATGSGKTSIINLLPRFYDVSSGKLLVDGRDIKEYVMASLRRHIGIVSQETFLFGDTIHNNIAYGRPNATLEEIVQAAATANIHDFIQSLPDGYDTEIGERGVNLSGGQKQRLSIARALVKDPEILILDDSTSAVDTETEAQIQNALTSVTKKRTTFIIAQRVSSVMFADKIVFLEEGRIVEMGTHETLLALNGKYASIYKMQFADRVREDAEHEEKRLSEESVSVEQTSSPAAAREQGESRTPVPDTTSVREDDTPGEPPTDLAIGTGFPNQVSSALSSPDVGSGPALHETLEDVDG